MAADRPAVTATPPRRPASRPKALWIELHLYAGLTLGAVFAVLGLTGSINVYRDEVDQWLHPSYYSNDNDGPYRRLGDITQVASRLGGGAAAASIEIPASFPGTAIVAFPAPSGNAREVYVDRASGQILGVRTNGQSVSDVIFHLHGTFFIEPIGARTSGILGLLLLASVLSGVYIWWPKRSFADGFRVHFRGSRKRMYFELHRAIGGAAAALLIVAAATGLSMSFPEPFDALAGTTDDSEPMVAGAVAPVTVDGALAAAQARFPDGSLRHVAVLGDPASSLRVIMRGPGEPTWRGGQSRIWINMASGEVERLRDPAGYTSVQTAVDWLPALHTGDPFGAVGRVVVFVTGLMPALLFFTGLRLWMLRRRRADRR